MKFRRVLLAGVGASKDTTSVLGVTERETDRQTDRDRDRETETERVQTLRRSVLGEIYIDIYI